MPTGSLGNAAQSNCLSSDEVLSLVHRDGGAPTARFPDAFVVADIHDPTLIAGVLPALVRADARTPALIAIVLQALVRAEGLSSFIALDSRPDPLFRHLLLPLPLARHVRGEPCRLCLLWCSSWGCRMHELAGPDLSGRRRPRPSLQGPLSLAALDRFQQSFGYRTEL
jgi:hypothetical protein